MVVSKDTNRTRIRNSVFWKLPSTLVATAIRLGLAFAVTGQNAELLLPSEWRTSMSWTCILLKPRYTLSHVREALAIQQLVSGRFVDAYEANHHRIQLPPLLLAALEPLAQSPNAEIFMALLAIFLDYVLACCLESLARWVLFSNRAENVDKETEDQETLHESIRPMHAHIFAVSQSMVTESTNDDTSKTSTPSLVPMESLPLLAAQFYYWSPFAVLSGAVYGCLQQLPTVFLVLALWEGVRPRGSPTLSSFMLACATYLELHHCIFLVPLAAFRVQSRSRQVLLVASFVVWSVCLQGLSYQLVGASRLPKVLRAVYGLGWQRPTQSLSVQWYFAVQLFSRFRDYFEILIVTLPYMVVLPIAIRLYQYPMVLVALFSIIWTIFRPVQTLLDANISLAFFLLCPRCLARMGKASFVAICSIGVPVVMCVVDHWMWLEPNNGNANFVYFQCLAYNGFLAILLGQFCSASLQRDKALRLSRKEARQSAEASTNN